MRNALVLYHANCLDGFAAAWVAHHAFEQTGEPPPEFRAMHYGDPIPTDEELFAACVYVLDFSFPPVSMARIAMMSRRLVWLDHHKTAGEYLPEFQHRTRRLGEEDIHVNIDQTHSGAVLTWRHFFGERAPVPDILLHVEDRDLWQFKLIDTREICAALYSYPFDPSEFDLWTFLAQDCIVDDLRTEGRAILRQHDKYVGQVIAASQPSDAFITLGNFTGPAINAPGFLASDVGHNLLKMMDDGKLPAGDFAATYFDTPTHRIYSLRSDDSRADVSAIAKLYGGGGHRNAAGFKAARPW